MVANIYKIIDIQISIIITKGKNIKKLIRQIENSFLNNLSFVEMNNENKPNILKTKI